MNRLSVSSIKKAILVWLLVMIPPLIPLYPIPAHAQSTSSLISVWNQPHRSNNITDAGLFIGSSFTVSINLTEVETFSVYTFQVYYDETRLRATSLSLDGTIFGPDAVPVRLDFARLGLVDVGVFTTTPVSGTGVLVFMAFQVVGNGWSPIDIENDIIGLGSTRIPHNTQDGFFNNIPLGPLLPDFSKAPVAGYYETSEYLAGSVAVGVIIVESNGTRYDWADHEVNDTITGIQQAMEWWAAQEPRARLSFQYDIHVRVPVSVEPIEMRIFDAFLAMEEAMRNLGHGTGYVYSSVQSYVNSIRTQYGTDWAFAVFVADSDPAIGQGSFLDSAYEIASIGGPWFIMARMSSVAWNSGQYQKAVPAHATGHIFYATDEYDGYPSYSGYLAARDRDFIFGLMNQNDLKLSYSTRLQVGWRDTDGDGILDIMDTFPSTVIRAQEILGDGRVGFSATTVEVPHRNINPFGQRNHLTINRITSVEARFDGGDWLPAVASDGAFDEALENFTIASPTLAPGTHVVELRAANSAGNTATISQSLMVEAPLTELARWQARPAHRHLDLARHSTQTFEAFVRNPGDRDAYVHISVRITDETSQTVRVTSDSRLILQGESMTLVLDWYPLAASARYHVIVSLYESRISLPVSAVGWTLADEKSFAFTVAA